jgi:hypothetical protein
MRSGFGQSAIAVIARWSWPPETWWGKRSPMVVGIGQAEPGEELARPRLGVAAGHDAVPDRGLDHLVDQPVRGVEGRRGGLGDVGDLPPAQAAQPGGLEAEDVAAVEVTLPPVISTAAAVGHRREADGRLARAGFADQAHHLAAGERQRDAVDDGDALGRLAGGIGGGLDPQVADVEQRLLGHDFSTAASLEARTCASAPSRRRG